MTHILACALACNGSGGAGGEFIAWAVIVVFGIAGVIGVIVRISRHLDNHRRGLPPEPFTDMSPAMASLLSGRNVPAYTAPVAAVTPGGVPVRYGRCCGRGHQSPAQAVAHAASVSARIGVHGR